MNTPPRNPSWKTGGILHLFLKSRMEIAHTCRHSIPPTLKEYTYELPHPTPCNLHIFRFMIAFASCFMMC